MHNLLRDYQPDDWEAVREIYDLSKPDEMRGAVPSISILPLNAHPEMVTLFHQSAIVVAELDEKVVGFAGCKSSYISWLFVHPAHRRKGIASALLQSVLPKLEGTATLNVAASNVAARQLYSRLGFVTEREFEGKFNGHSCAVIKLRYAPAD